MIETALKEQGMASNTAVRMAKQSLRKVMRERITQIPANAVLEQCACSVTHR